MPVLRFTVDAALLAELGERLVGKPYIALAELVKNSYDADATKVTVELDVSNKRIVVTDNGHGMDPEEFERYWMRVGSTHKLKLRVSRNFKRPMTGSKGVGRLAVQYLANKMDLYTVSEKNLHQRLEAHVKWDEATKTDYLTNVAVEYDIKTIESPTQGTSIVLTELKEVWDAKPIKGLAEEVWWLPPPFRSRLTPVEDPKKVFEIEFLSDVKYFVDLFDDQMHAILNIWEARIVGKNVDGQVTSSLEFVGEEPITLKYSLENGVLKNGDFEIRIYNLFRRQPRGIKVQEARDYMNRFGGVHVYDGGFHLPYYGNPKNDWLNIEQDHSHRLSMSQLLPNELQVDWGMQFLPTLSRILGVVNVDTKKEDDLNILITRDRLQDSPAFEDLAYMVRYALDFYAMEEKKRESKPILAEIEKPKFQKVEDALIEYKSEIPGATYENIRRDIKKATDEIETQAETTAKKVSLMGPLATAGISSLAYQHETKRQFHTIDEILARVQEIEGQVQDENVRKALKEVRESLSTWSERARATNALFSYFTDIEDMTIRRRYPAMAIIEEIGRQVKFLARGIPIDANRLSVDLLLPSASLGEWSSIFQNVFINAFNAMIDSKEKLISVSSRTHDRVREILVQDTGSGVDLKEAETYFEPFKRKLKISPERQALGYGGTGLGLTIVRLIANNIGCEVSFVEPEKGFKTAFSLRWREAK